jgi:hypothetical protein
MQQLIQVAHVYARMLEKGDASYAMSLKVYAQAVEDVLERSVEEEEEQHAPAQARDQL